MFWRNNFINFENLSQVGHLGEAYQEWVHQPIVSKEGPRFFQSDFWEVITSYMSFGYFILLLS